MEVVIGLLIIAGLVVTCLFANKIADESRENYKSHAAAKERKEHEERQAAAERERLLAEKIEAFKNAFARRAIDMGLMCQCGKLAIPIPGTSDRYRCSECADQFVGAKHDLPYFEDALKKALG